LPDSDLDKAFDLLVVIIALIYSIAGSYPELFAPSNVPGLSSEIITMRNTVIPLIILTVLWLASILIPNKKGQVLLKSVAWMTALTLAIMLFIHFLYEGAKLIPMSKLIFLVKMVLMFIGSPLIVWKLIIPQYKKKYPDEHFFEGKISLVVSYALYLLIMGTVFWILTTHYVAY
jgi:hypothetical protein